MHLSELIHQPQFSSAAQEALLNVLVTESWVTSEFAATLAPLEITPAQYNVLRILRGTHPRPQTCSDIAERLLDRTPDVTRLLVRLERAALIARCRAEHDRRVVEVSITDKGLDLLSRLDDPMDQAIGRLTRHLSDEELQTLSSLLDRLRTDQE
ncbi:MAG: MarR family transcriptional regulator [Rhodothermaceae bacterium]|nr:MarR family transcriptional regulator [Rhodothermaceae bacterium]